jgi:drug/metabolite transporter (DMT)-like permease
MAVLHGCDWRSQPPVFKTGPSVFRYRRSFLPSFVLYGLTVAIWGTSWYVITLQTGVVPVALSIAFRFLLACILLIAFCLATRRRLAFGLRDHLFMAAQGICLFSLNYLLFYEASLDMPSGLMAVCFSTILLMNIGNGALFFRSRVDARVFIGALFGLGGLTMVFWPEVAGFGLRSKEATGLVLSLIATYFASLGNMVSVRHKLARIPVVESNAIGMTYGALCSFAIAAVLRVPFVYDWRPMFSIALFYLAVVASIVGFGCFLTLIQRIGADRAAYATVLFPIVALGLSTWLEHYRWTPLASAGLALVLLGNILVLVRRKLPVKDPLPT